jgi:hypothetical protein
LPKSHSHYKKFLDLRGDGRVVLYKRADHENPKWTVRLKIPTTSGFVVKSTKTTDDFEARRFAEELYYRLEGKVRRGEPINSPTFSKVFSEWSKISAADREARSVKSHSTPTPLSLPKMTLHRWWCNGAETGVAEPHIAEQSRSWRAASGEPEVMRGS